MKTVHFEGDDYSDLDELWADYVVLAHNIQTEIDVLRCEKNRLDYCYESARRELLEDEPS